MRNLGARLAIALLLLSSGCSVVEKNIYVYNYKDGTVTTPYTTSATINVETDANFDIPILP